MGCCVSKKSPTSTSLSNGRCCAVKSDVNKPVKPVLELPNNPVIEEVKPVVMSASVQQEGDDTKNEDKIGSNKTDSEESPAYASVTVEKSIDSKSNTNSVVVVRTSSCTKEEIDAILIQCGKLSQSNTPAKTRRYSGSKRSFDFDQNDRIRGGDVEEAERKTNRNSQRGGERVRVRVNGSPRERSRRTPSRERVHGGGVKRTETKNPNLNPNLCGGSGVSVNSSNNRTGKFVTVPAREKRSSNKRETSVKRIAVRRNITEACRAAASPASKVQPPPPPPPLLSRSSSRKAEQSPPRRTPLGEINQNSTKGDKIGSNNNKRMIIESTKLRGASPNRSRSTLRKCREFGFVKETLLQSNEEDSNTGNYTALLLKDIQNFNNNNEDPLISFNLLPSCVTKACSIVEAVADLNSTNQFRFTSTA